jgi:hypothetical protein
MKTIVRRLRKLEDRFCPPVETEFDRQLRGRIEAGRRRVAEHGEWCGSVDDGEEENLAGLSMIEILHRGRERVARAKAGREKTPAVSRRGRAGWDNRPPLPKERA